MKTKTVLFIVVLASLGYLLYDPVMDRFFTDHSLKVSEGPQLPDEVFQTVHLRTDGVDLALSRYGGRIISARLLDYQTKNGNPVELISGLLKTRSGVRIELPGVLDDPDDTLYTYQTNGPEEIFARVLRNGLELHKSYRPKGRYAVEFRFTLTNRGKREIFFPEGCRLIPFYGIHPENEKESGTLQVAWKSRLGEKVRREKAGKIRKPFGSKGPVEWVGLENRYFTQIFLPLSGSVQARFFPLGRRQVYCTLSSSPFLLRPGENYEEAGLLYLGPLDEEALRSCFAGLERIVDYGTFEFLGKGILLILRWLHGYVINYGLCLILLALVLRVLLFPVTQYNLRSLREMPAILQEIYDIEEEDKADPKRAEERIRPLRKRQMHAVIGSFLPLVVQIPVFLALYQALNNSIDLRRAAFFLWITDLSVRDPFFLLPLLMGGAMVLQQRLTSSNPGRDRTWIWIPVGFSLLFAFFPSGLVLFWFSDSLFSVGQLLWIAGGQKEGRRMGRS